MEYPVPSSFVGNVNALLHAASPSALMLKHHTGGSRSCKFSPVRVKSNSSHVAGGGNEGGSGGN